MGEVVNYSAKVDIEVKEALIREIEGSGKTAGEFLASLLTTYEVSKSRESLVEIREINQLKNHLARIEEIYIAMAKSRQDGEERAERTANELLEQLKNMKGELVDTQAKAKEQVQAITDYANNVKEEAERQIDESKKSVLAAFEARDQAQAAQAQAEKITSMSEEASTQLKEQIITLKETALTAQQSLVVVQQQLVEARDTAQTDRQQTDVVVAEMKEQLSNSLAEIAALQARLTNERQQAELDRERAVLAAEREAVKERKALQDEIVKLRDSLAAEREARALAVKK